MEAKIEVKNFSVLAGNTIVLKDISFKTGKSGITSIVGASGAGKTTLLRSINRLLEEDHCYSFTGDIKLNGKSIFQEKNKYNIRRRIGIVFQKPIVFPASIKKNVLFGAKHTLRDSKRSEMEIVENCLTESALWQEVKDRLDEPARNLSVGQQQRLAIARTLAVAPEVILMDEPTSALDQNAAREIERLIIDLGINHTVIMVTHNLTQAKKISQKIIKLKSGSTGSTSENINLDDFDPKN